MARIYPFPADSVEIDLSRSAEASPVHEARISEKWWKLSRCSEEEKQELIPLLVDLFTLHHTMQEEGVGCLKRNFALWRDPFQREALRMLLRGDDPASMDKNLIRRISRARVKGRALLEKLMIRSALNSMAVGNLPGTTHRLLMELLDFDDPTCVVSILFEALLQSKNEDGEKVLSFR